MHVVLTCYIMAKTSPPKMKRIHLLCIVCKNRHNEVCDLTLLIARSKDSCLYNSIGNILMADSYLLLYATSKVPIRYARCKHGTFFHNGTPLLTWNLFKTL